MRRKKTVNQSAVSDLATAGDSIEKAKRHLARAARRGIHPVASVATFATAGGDEAEHIGDADSIHLRMAVRLLKMARRSLQLARKRSNEHTIVADQETLRGDA